jgi:murein DD-endopeptidase MepM/ murein hydrolase activator NlpD
MSSSNDFITALYNVLGDSESYFQFQKDMVTKSVEDLYFNNFKGRTDFRAVVISVDMGSLNSTTQQQAIRVRPLDIHDFLLPEPCSTKLCEKAKMAVITMHPVAYSVEIPTQLAPTEGGSVKLLTNQIRVGDIVTCEFMMGPENNGQMRALSFKPFTRGQGKRSNLMVDCLSKEGQGVKYALDFPNAQPNRPAAPSDPPNITAPTTRTDPTGQTSFPVPVGISAYTKTSEFSTKEYPSSGKGRFNSGYGYRIHPISKKRKFHTGIDITAPINEPIFAIADGEVLQSRGTTVGGTPVCGFGAWVVIKHTNITAWSPDGSSHPHEYPELYSIYGHINGSYVKKGETVKQGQPVAAMGTEGQSTGVHLHFEIWTPKGSKWNGDHLDPTKVFNWDIAVTTPKEARRIRKEKKKK